MYEKDGVTLSVEDVQLNAKISDITPEAWASKNGFNSIKEEEDPGKPEGSAKTAVVGPTPATSSGALRSEDISQGLPGVKLALDTESNVGTLGAEVIQARADVTASSVADQIAAAYFSLENKNGEWGVKGLSDYAFSSGFDGFTQGDGAADSRQLNETGEAQLKAGLIDAMGAAKAEQWLELTGGDLSISEEDLKEKVNLDIIDQQTKDSVLSQRQQEAAELVLRGKSKEEIEALKDLMLSPEERAANVDFIETESNLLDVGKSYLDAELKIFSENRDQITRQSKEFEAEVDRKKEVLESYTIVPGIAQPEGYRDAFEAYEASIDNYNGFIASEEVTALGDTAARLTAASDLYNERIQKLSVVSGQTIDNALVSAAATKDYSALAAISFNVEDAILGTTSALLGLGADGLNYLIDNEKASEVLDNFKGRTGQYAINLEKKRIEELPSALTMDQVESGKIGYNDFIADVALNNTATVLTVLLPSGAASMGAKLATRGASVVAKRAVTKQALRRANALTMGLFFTMETGGSLNAIDSSKREALEISKITGLTEIETLTNKLDKNDYAGQLEKTAIESRIEELSSALNVTEIERSFTAITKGGIAMYAERIGTLRSLQNLGKWSKGLGKAQFAKYLSKPVANWASKAAGTVVGTSRLLGMEVIEEGFTLAGHNLLDINVLQQNKSVTDGMDKDFLANVMIPTLIIGSPTAAGNLTSTIRSEYLTRKQATKNSALVEKVFQLQDKLENSNMSEYDRSVVEQKKKDVLNELALDEANALIDAGMLSAVDLETLAGLQGELSLLRSQAAALGLENIDNEELTSLKKQISDVVTKREGILQSGDKKIAEKVKDAQDQAEAGMRYQAFKRNEYAAKAYSGDKFVSITEDSDYDSLPENLREEAKAAGLNKFGFFKNGYAVVFNKNIEAAIMMGGDNALFASVAPLHEIAHNEISKKGLISNAELSNLGGRVIADIKETIQAKVIAKEITSAQATTFLKRVDAYQALAAKQGASIDVEEVMMIIGDMKAGGVLNTNDFQLLPLVKAFVNTTLNKVAPKLRLFVPLNNYKDVSSFFNRFQGKVIDGKAKAQTDPPKETDAKASTGTVLEAINALVPADVTTKAEFQNRKVFNAVYAATEPGGAISNYVRSKSESKEVADKAMESVVDRLINYDPAAVRKKANGDPITFGEFIFANTNFGKLDARKSLAIEAKETARKVSIDSEQAKEIADKDTAADPRDTGKSKRMNLVTRGVVSTEAISKAQETVKRAIGALKVPFNKNTSLNVTVKPYIAALKKGFAEKELVKAVAQDMGNGGDLKSWMRKHKTAILDNMTTTYLIGAFPAAIQKQVKGTDTWTSDWAGKEIQREKTTTANAGRTSGAFMVRRLPNASSKISDAEFVEMLFDDKGVIKPGKKPSLAKAIAEEIGFDILTTEIQNPDGPIAEAFKDNQEALGVVLFDNYVAEAKKDAERGSAKFSIGDKYAQAAGRLFREAQQDLDNTIDEQGNILVNPEIYTEYEDIGIFVRNAFDEGIVSEAPVLRFLQSIKSNEKISQKIKDEVAKALSAKRTKAETLNEFANDMGVVAEALGSDIMNVISYDGLGFINRVLDSAASKLDKLTNKKIPGATGNFFKYLTNLKAKVKDGAALPPGLELSKVRPMNSKIGIMAKIARILNQDISAAKKKELYEKLIPEVEAANMQNKLLAKHIITELVKLVKVGKISKASFINMLQLQTQATKGLRSLTGLKYITFKDRPQGNIKGEHLADNASSMLEIVDLAFEELTDAELSTKIDGILEYHDQWLENKETLKLVDVFGANNPFKDLRIRSLSKSDQLDVFTYNLKPAETLIKARENAIRTLTKTIPLTRRAESAKRTEQDIAKNKALAKFSVTQETDMSKAINDMIERNKGVQSEKVFSAVQAKKRGKTIGKYNFLSPAADDFRGLTSYTFAGKGKQGEADQKFFEDAMVKPYQRGINAIDVAKQTIKNDFTAVVKAFAPQAKIMRNKIPGSDYTYDQAIRVYMWTRQGTEVPGMSKRDLALLNKTVAEDPAMIAFADAMLLVSKQGEWMAPGEHWLTNTVLSDLNNMSEKIGRKIYLEEFLVAKDIIFSEENLAKIEAVYGSKYVSALKDILYRMENGTNRPTGDDATTNRWLNWINQSTGAIMFFNRRSAILQLLSTVNFINWSDNNPVKAAMAFANQKQFWGDFAMLFNSPKLKQRRAGLRTDVSQAEIANAVAGQTNKASAVLNYLLKIGFTPTQIADSFAVASGGAAFYRNRVNTYLKQGKSQKEAETLAFEEFSSTADEAQQSSDPMLISQQQASMLGRLVLSFQNTTMQYSRLMKKATLDLVNGRGDPKTNISKIIYYGAVQNFVFSALQSALFAVIPGFGGDDEDDEEVLNDKGIRILNSMFDSLLKGTGLTGAVIATIKNVIQEYAKQEEKGYNADHIYTFLRLMSISPPIGSKISKLYKAQQTKRFEKDALAARPFSVVVDGRVNLGPGYRIAGNIAAATVNLPLDRVVDEVSSLSEALDNRNSQWQRLALALGWKSWDVGAKNEENDLLKAKGKAKRSENKGGKRGKSRTNKARSNKARSN